jgi:hypothetical protein
MEPLASGTYHMAWLSFEEPIRRRACLFFFKKKRHTCRDPNASQDIEEKTDESIQKGKI